MRSIHTKPYLMIIDALMAWGLPRASSRVVEGEIYDLYWPVHSVLATKGTASKSLIEACLDLGIDVVEVPVAPPSSVPAELGAYFKR